MRREMTLPERTLWNEVRAHRLQGVKFRRQTVVGRYIADFTCRSPIMLVVEIDGETHVGREDYDLVRTGYFEARGYQVLRFSNYDVMSNLDGVLTTIVSALADSPSP
jgi:very-short-patch-repair endonuclease